MIFEIYLHNKADSIEYQAETRNLKCGECGNVCDFVEESHDSFDLIGNPCTHNTGHYVSDCCLAELDEV